MKFVVKNPFKLKTDNPFKTVADVPKPKATPPPNQIFPSNIITSIQEKKKARVSCDATAQEDGTVKLENCHLEASEQKKGLAELEIKNAEIKPGPEEETASEETVVDEENEQ